MSIEKNVFTWENGYEDDEKEFRIEVIATNSSDQIIELAKTSCVLMNSDGATFAGSFRDEEDVFLEPKETANVDVRCGYSFHESAFGQDASSISAQVDLTLFRREFFNLGEFDVPKEEKSCIQLTKHQDVAGGHLAILGATLFRHKQDDDGETNIQTTVGLRNTGEGEVQKAVVKMILVDREGSQLDYSEYDETIPPRSSVIIEPSIFCKTGRLKGAKIKLTVSLYQPVLREALLLKNPDKAE